MTRVIDNKEGYPINRIVGLPVNISNNTGSTSLKEYDVAKKRVHRPRSSCLLNLKDHPSINNPNLGTLQLSDRDYRLKEKMAPRSKNAETQAMNDEASSFVSANDTPVEINCEKNQRWELPRDKNPARHSRSNVTTPR